MPKKHSDDTPGQKLLKLYYLLLFSGGKYTTRELMEKLECGKATITRLVQQLETTEYAKVNVDVRSNRQHVYSLKVPAKKPNVSLTADDLMKLIMCRDMVWHLLPQEFREKADKAIAHSKTLLGQNESNVDPFKHMVVSLSKGTVDYNSKAEILETILSAILKEKVLRINYSKPLESTTKEHYAAPYRLLTQKDALYVKCWRLLKQGQPKEIRPMTLAIHRIDKIELLDRTYAGPSEKNKGTFGIFEDEPFCAKIQFPKSSAYYVRERKWSDDQKISDQPDGGVILEFTATSLWEVAAMVLGFGPGAKALEPPELVKEIVSMLDKARAQYP